MLGGWEIVLILAVVILLFGAKYPGDTSNRFNRLRGFVADALTHSNKTYEYEGPPAYRKDGMPPPEKNSLVLWIAQGFGIGRIPFAPGTWGSLLGVGFFLLLIVLDQPWLVLVAPLIAMFAAVWVCDRAARILGKEDPPSVVLDEIVAVPLCMITMLVLLNYLLEPLKHAALWLHLASEAEGSGATLTSGIGETGPKLPEIFFGLWYSPCVLGLVFLQFLAFRLFDIWKPWPIRQSQRLPGGWGIVMDDVLAAVYVNLVMLTAYGVFSLFDR